MWFLNNDFSMRGTSRKEGKKIYPKSSDMRIKRVSISGKIKLKEYPRL